MKTLPPTYPQLTSAQITKLPWNRVKNIMNSVRAVISDIEHNHGYVNDIDDLLIDRELTEQYATVEQRQFAVEQITRPIKAYFDVLKARAADLPHESSRGKK